MSALNTRILLQPSNNQVIHNHVTIQTAADISGNSGQYLRRLLRAGKLESIRVGQVWLISVASLEEYLVRHTMEDDRRCGPKNVLKAGKRLRLRL